MLEIDILRNSSQKTLGVLRGAFKGFGAETPWLLRLCLHFAEVFVFACEVFLQVADGGHDGLGALLELVPMMHQQVLAPYKVKVEVSGVLQLSGDERKHLVYVFIG